MKELSGEIWLELEALGTDETLTSRQSDNVGKVVEALNILNQSLSEAEAGDESEREIGTDRRLISTWIKDSPAAYPSCPYLYRPFRNM